MDYYDDDEVHYSAAGMVWHGSGYKDEHGRSIKKTPQTHPYSYDGYVLHEANTDVEANNTIYTDRLSMWDYDKKERLMQKHFAKTGDWWNEYSPDQIEAFLRDWCDDPELKLRRVMQYCNVSSGYPLWRLDFKQTVKE